MPDTVILVHGLWMNGMEMTLLRRRLRNDYGFTTQQFSYRTMTRGLAENTEKFRAFIESLPAGKVGLVGHSLGGVLILHTLEQFPSEKVHRVVCLGSPLAGSAPAAMLSRINVGRELIGKTLKDGVLDHPLEAVGAFPEVGVIAGTSGVGIGTILGVLEKPHDGVVTVKETRLPGIADHLELPVNHISLILSRRVAKQTAHFLRHGEFQQS